MRQPDDFFKRDSVTLQDSQRMMNAEATIFGGETTVALSGELTKRRNNNFRRPVLRFIHTLHVVLVEDPDRDFIQMLPAAVRLCRIYAGFQHGLSGAIKRCDRELHCH